MSRASRIEILPLECGSTRGPVHVLEESRQGIVDLPAYAFLIRHPNGQDIVFDAGLPPSMDGEKLVGLFDVEVPDGQGLRRQLAAHDIDADRIEQIIISHAHADHVAGVELVPNARILINRHEYEAMRDHAAALALGHQRQLIDGDHDVFGDGSVEIIATPGHSCGHQSLRIRRTDGYDVLAGDACYFCATLSDPATRQPHAHDPQAYRTSLNRLREMWRKGDFIVPGHDPAFLDRIPAGSGVVRPAHPYWMAAGRQ